MAAAGPTHGELLPDMVVDSRGGATRDATLTGLVGDWRWMGGSRVIFDGVMHACQEGVFTVEDAGCRMTFGWRRPYVMASIL